MKKTTEICRINRIYSRNTMAKILSLFNISSGLSKVTKKTEYQSSNLYLIRSFSRNYQFILKIAMDFTNLGEIKQVRKSWMRVNPDWKQLVNNSYFSRIICLTFLYFNPFHATGLFRYPLKAAENLWFSVAFRGHQKTSGIKWVND